MPLVTQPCRAVMLVINCKNYAEVATWDRLQRLVAAAQGAADRYGVVVGVAPPTHLLGMMAGLLSPTPTPTPTPTETPTPTPTETDAAAGVKTARPAVVVPLAQHVDARPVGSTTGYVVPELLKAAGVAGSIINHSEHRIEEAEIKAVLARLRELRMISVLCVRDAAEAALYAEMNPDYIAIEPPELIGSGRAVSTERPELVSDVARAVSPTSARLLCGAGITSGTDVALAAELGASGILVASGVVVKGPDMWAGAISDLAKPLAASGRGGLP